MQTDVKSPVSQLHSLYQQLSMSGEVESEEVVSEEVLSEEVVCGLRGSCCR